MLRSLEIWVQTLHLYGAAGIAAFGWAMCRLLGWNAEPWLPMWICAALLLYNLDRLRRDPADRLNTPRREEAAQRLRVWSSLVMVISVGVLMLLPVKRRDWLTLFLTVGGAMVCLNYSLPVAGFRLKDVPLLKTFFAPTLVIAAVFGLPLLHGFGKWNVATFLAALWGWVLLFCNMLLCDLRDIPGDRACGVVSVPSALGARATRRLLWILAAITAAAGLLIAGTPTDRPMLWASLGIAGAAYVGGLVWAVHRDRSERFYEWWVEGVLFVPAVVVWLAGA